MKKKTKISHKFRKVAIVVFVAAATFAASLKFINSAVCHSNGFLPDPVCTPGSIDPRVTQNNIHQTICLTGYTATVRPPVTYTEPLKIKSIKAYGYADTKLGDYEMDHLIPLELGGNPTDIKNLWAEPGASPNAKDVIESTCRTKVCAGTITLIEAQKEISTDWRNACK